MYGGVDSNNESIHYLSEGHVVSGSSCGCPNPPYQQDTIRAAFLRNIYFYNAVTYIPCNGKVLQVDGPCANNSFKTTRISIILAPCLLIMPKLISILFGRLGIGFLLIILPKKDPKALSPIDLIG